MTKITKDNYPDTAIDRLENFIALEQAQIAIMETDRKRNDNAWATIPRSKFDQILNNHKENIRALKFAINNIKRNKKWEELTPEEKSKACTVNAKYDPEYVE